MPLWGEGEVEKVKRSSNGRALVQGPRPACSPTYLTVGPRGPAMLSTELVQGLETNVQLGRARTLGKICYHRKSGSASELSKDF